jgi:hypothetical protein
MKTQPMIHKQSGQSGEVPENRVAEAQQSGEFERAVKMKNPKGVESYVAHSQVAAHLAADWKIIPEN